MTTCYSNVSIFFPHKLIQPQKHISKLFALIFKSEVVPYLSPKRTNSEIKKVNQFFVSFCTFLKTIVNRGQPI